MGPAIIDRVEAAVTVCTGLFRDKALCSPQEHEGLWGYLI